VWILLPSDYPTSFLPQAASDSQSPNLTQMKLSQLHL
jgi:hypothetical protein